MSDKPKRRPRRRSRILASVPADGGGEEWMLTYMDTVTLLVVLFVMLLSFSSIDAKKYDAFTQGMDLQKYGGRVVLGTPEKAGPSPIDVAPGAPPAGPTPSSAAEALRDQFAGRELPDGVSMKMRENSVAFEIQERVLFPSGQADLTPRGQRVVHGLAPLFANKNLALDVEGHTDDVPISTDRFPSNWELSAARAASVARALVDAGIAEQRLRIVGYADTRPIAENGTDQGRARNRRVSLVVRVPDKP